MARREYQVSEQAVQQARYWGITGDVTRRVARMARQAAPHTLEPFNRRFEEFVLQVEGDVVVAFSRLDEDHGGSQE